MEERGLKTGWYIPNRLNEGYGLNKEAIKKIKEQGYNLIITVDCGISSIEEVDYANSLGMEVIITDHHEPIEILPKALAIVNAKRKDSVYPFRELAGVGTTFKLIQAISNKLQLDRKKSLKYLDLVCVGTISDIVPLIDENRVITKFGLRLVKETRNIGLKTLLSSMGLKDINVYSISFGVAPRINACGRLGYENEALELLLTNNITKAKDITEKLNKYNLERQTIEKNILVEADKEIAKEIDEKSSIILGKENWHNGVIGIVASKIVEKYSKPTILVCFDGNIGKGSGRSIPNFQLHQALQEISEFLEQYGGHSMAVGLTVKKENFEKFREAFEKYAESKNVKEYVPTINIDGVITKLNINEEFLNELELLQPFGEKNREPIFIYKSLKINSIRTLSEGKHIKLNLNDEGKHIDAIGFNLGHLADEYLIGDRVDIVGTLEKNQYNGNVEIQINVKDMMKSL